MIVISRTLLTAAAFALSSLSIACHAQAPAPTNSSATAEAGKGVVSSADPRATAAGQEMLRKGGSAADAAMAMMLTLAVVEPQSSGVGGGGLLLHHDAATGQINTIDGREMAPSAATDQWLLGEDGKPKPFIDAFQGGRAVGVPGNIRLMAMTHAKWGKLPWADLFAPAIKMADEGFEVSNVLANTLTRLAPIWARFPDARAIYWNATGPKAAGDRVTNPALAELLRAVAKDGPDAFYSGKHGQALVDAVSKAGVNPAPMTMADLAAYTAKERPAVCSRYRGYKVCGMGPPSSGATTVQQILGMLQPHDIGRLGKDDPKTWHLIGEAMQLAYADREQYLGDADFVSVPVNGLLDPAYVASRAATIDPARALNRYEAGNPPGAEPRTAAISSEVEGTTHFVAVDGAGNVVSMTSTVEGPFGSQLIANGYFLNNEMTDFTFAPERNGAKVANRVQPGKRPLSSMSPHIVYDASDRPVLAVGSAGGKRIIMHVTKALIGVIDFGLPAGEALALPNIYFGNGSLIVEGKTELGGMSEALAAFGQPVVVSDLGSKLNAAQLTGGVWTGYADPRSPGVALAQ
ncbi:gamma-glutamyltransferase [Blastomonas aquatica]|uniref:Glutathione hydrolase proenzyme n=1 Tax=Blastomonas aquatica TaxID=1510276 RepID=A0ABQ1JMS8_9SPHN|nr:gamma-glutamyltransferase [Blastomonas aquatica]GGB70243.1 gamma-glutamyltransferase [Blastomonas aquatica]